jgi:DNA-directed RNA polymerase sigma subunit (sigma70/sigma32)
LSNVSAHQRLVLEMAFGITTPGCFSDEEIAQLMDVSLQEVTEMKLHALEKMRSFALRRKVNRNR